MKSTSKVIMGATLVMVLSLAIVLGLILVLLAELYCTLLLRRRRLRTTSSNTTPTAIISPTLDASSSSQHPQSRNKQSSPPLTTYYAQGVLQAPRSFLFPAAFCNKDTTEPVNKHSQQHHVLEVPAQGPNTNPQLIGVASPSESPRESPVQIITSNACNEKACAVGREHLVYISNPIYDNEASRPGLSDTPFETPDSSPSRLEIGGHSSSGDEEMSPTSPPVTPPLTPMKKLPAEASSISLRDASSLGILGSDSVSQNGLSSSSSGTPGTSPSW